jgi:hypothetical protein
MPRPKEPLVHAHMGGRRGGSSARAQGWSISAIARHLGRDRKTIRAYLDGERTPGQSQQHTRTFATTTKGLVALRSWLASQQVSLVGMESLSQVDVRRGTGPRLMAAFCNLAIGAYAMLPTRRRWRRPSDSPAPTFRSNDVAGPGAQSELTRPGSRDRWGCRL